MQAIKWTNRALHTQLSDKSLNKPSFFSKYSPSRQKNPSKKQMGFIQNAKSKAQFNSSAQKNHDTTQKSFSQKSSTNVCNLKKVKQCISSGRKIKAKFPIRQMQNYDNKAQFKAFARSILKEIQHIVDNLVTVFHDVHYMLKDLQKNFRLEVSKAMQINPSPSFKGLQNFSIRKTESINMNEKNETIKSFPHINYSTEPKTVKKVPYNSQIAQKQIENTLPKTIKNSCMHTETTELPSQTNLFKIKKDCEDIHRGCKSARNNNIMKRQQNSPDSRSSSISVEMNKIKGALGQMKNMLGKK